MRKLFFILTFILFSLCANAQDDNNYFSISDYHAAAGINADIDLASLSVSNHFMNTFLLNDHIDSTSKQWMFNALKKYNTFGFDLDEKISMISFPDTFAGYTNMGIFVSYGSHYHIDMEASRDLMKLFFGGNTQFKGKTASLDHSSLNLISYQQIQIGFLSRFGEGRLHHTFGIGISINNGIQNTKIEIEHGSLFTEKDAKYLDISASYDIYRSDTSKSGGFKGIGSSLNLYYSFLTDKNNRFDFSVTDLGFISWNKNSQHFSKDTAIHFEGVSINDPLNIEENIFDNSNPDSIVHTYTYADTAMPYIMPTPACFRIAYLHHYSDMLSIEVSVVKKLYVNFDPLYMIKANMAIGKNNILSLNMNYGGYSGSDPLVSRNLNTGIEYLHRFGKGLVLHAGTNYLNGFINPETQTAQGIYVSLKKYFF